MPTALKALVAAGWLLAAGAAQATETILFNGRIATLDAARPWAQALAVRDGRLLAVGAAREITRLATPATRLVDLGGRTVVPGLIDSHIHAIRAGLTFETEAHWAGARTIAEAMERLRESAARTAPGAWIVVAGGWTPTQFHERRRPTRAEIVAAAPGRRVYVQDLYRAVLLSPEGAAALGALQDVTEERDDHGQPTGWLRGDARAIAAAFDRLPQPAPARQEESTRAYFRTLNSVGLTGVIDPGGYNMPLAAYAPLFRLWREGGLTLRVAYSISAPRPGREQADFETLTAALPMGMGDDWLRFNGLGENVAWSFYNNDAPDAADAAALERLLRFAAARELAVTFHWNNDRSVGRLLDVLERVDRARPLAPLRWSIAHLHDASSATLARMKALDVGWLMQNAMYFRAEAFLGQRGAEALRLAPPIATALRMGLRVGAGTDAHRVMTHHPFVALQWMLDGKSAGGLPSRDAQETPTREEALRLYTQGSAWFAHDETRRGALKPGMLADLAVLSGDYFTMPTEDIGGLRSLLTMVGGRIVYAAGPFVALEEVRTTAPAPAPGAR